MIFTIITFLFIENIFWIKRQDESFRIARDSMFDVANVFFHVLRSDCNKKNFDRVWRRTKLFLHPSNTHPSNPALWKTNSFLA
jgi:hypothetical protein